MENIALNYKIENIATINWTLGEITFSIGGVLVVLGLLALGVVMIVKYNYAKAEWIMSYMQHHGWTLRQDSYFYKNNNRILFSDLLLYSRHKIKNILKEEERNTTNE